MQKQITIVTNATQNVGFSYVQKKYFFKQLMNCSFVIAFSAETIGLQKAVAEHWTLLLIKVLLNQWAYLNDLIVKKNIYW